MAKRTRKVLRSAARKSSKRAAKSVRKAANNVTSKSARIAAKSKRKTVAGSNRKPAAAKIDPLNRKNAAAITPMLTVRDVRKAVDFYTRGLAFKVQNILEGSAGRIEHAEVRLRDTTLMLSPESREMNSWSAKTIGNTPVTLYIMVEDIGKVYKQAQAAGAQTLMPVTDMFWGDRCCTIVDPDGNKIMIATHKLEPTKAELQAAMERQLQTRESAAVEVAQFVAVAESEY